MKIGNFVRGQFQPMQPSTYLSMGAISVHDQVYEVRGIPREAISPVEQGACLNNLWNLDIEGMNVLGVEVDYDMIRMQVRANSFSWAALIGVLPSLIVPLVALVIGIIIALKIPDWSLSALPIAVGGGIVLYAVSKSKGR